MIPLAHFKTWSPFKIDALGIVTLLGANSLRRVTARLVPNPIAEYLPLFAPHIFADDSIVDNLPGFALYNITDGIKATDLSSWFTRWLSCQQLGWQETSLTIQIQQETPKPSIPWYISMGFAAVVSCFLIAFPVLLGDWYGFASSTGLVTTVLARCYILHESRRALDRFAVEGTVLSADPVKLVGTLPNGRIVTIYTTRGLTLKCLLTEAKPQNEQLRTIIRAINWSAFGVHAVSLGMACLCMQLIIVGITLVSSIIMVQQTLCDESRLGRHLEIKQVDDLSVDTRSKAYIKLALTLEEENSMVAWGLFPLRSNQGWWAKYRALQTASNKEANNSEHNLY